MATPRDAVTLLRRLNINGAGLNGIGGGSRAAGRARAPRPAAQRRFLATPAKPQPAEPDATLKLAMGVIDAEAARVRASLAALDAQLAALPSDSPDRAALLSQKKHAEAALVFGDLSAHRELALGVRTARTLPLRHDAFEARRLPVLLDHAKRDGTLWDIFGHWEFEPKVDVSISFGAEEGLGKANVYKGEPSDCRFNAPVIRVEGWDGDDVRPAEGRYLSVVVMDLGEHRAKRAQFLGSV